MFFYLSFCFISKGDQNMLPSGNIKLNTVSGVGSGLVDFLIFGDDSLIVDMAVEKGGMTLVERNVIDSVLERINKEDLIIVPGGAACNTIVGISQLGGSARFIGKIGLDNKGNLFEKALRERNVEPCLFYSALTTGQVISIITPDAQRTMLTYLGASSEISPEEIIPEHFKNSKLVHVEGYLLFNQELLIKILEYAKYSGALVSLDLSSFTVVSEYLETLNELIPRYVDILIGNEDEAKAYTGHNDGVKILKSMAKNVDIAVLKLGERGSLISYYDSIYDIKPFPMENAIDTTGAGDLWAAGFLFGIVNNFSPEKCGELASVCGGEVCSVVGASIPNDSWRKIKDVMCRLQN
jgi:sugar/nucleoside kinase (ribokinase family)